MNRDPSTEKDGGMATPNNAPDGGTMREVSTVISRQRAVVDRAHINKGPLNKVVDKKNKQHCLGRCGRGFGWCLPNATRFDPWERALRDLALIMNTHMAEK